MSYGYGKYKGITWSMLTKIEPRLKDLQRDIKAVRPDDDDIHFCANRVWYRQFKERLLTLVGWEASKNNEILRSQDAYDLATKYLFSLLPDCRDCICMRKQ